MPRLCSWALFHVVEFAPQRCDALPTHGFDTLELVTAGVAKAGKRDQWIALLGAVESDLHEASPVERKAMGGGRTKQIGPGASATRPGPLATEGVACDAFNVALVRAAPQRHLRANPQTHMADSSTAVPARSGGGSARGSMGKPGA